MAGLGDALLAAGPPAMGKKPMPGAPPAEGDDLDIPAQDLIAAVKADDVEGVKAALRAAYDVCMSGHEMAEEK